jgi:bifunctional non-homologous end joining protein LigD
MPARPAIATTWPVAPMKAASGDLPTGPGWIFEPKWDGHRALVRVQGRRVAAVSSTGQDRTASWPWLAELGELGLSDTVLDGEVVAYDEDGRHRFQLVGRADRPHTIVLFDVLVHDAVDVTRQPWTARRALLTAIVRPSPHVSVTPVSEDAPALFDVTRRAGFEGIIAKRTDSVYLPGRRAPTWRKVKHRLEQEFVVGGYLLGEGARATTFGSLIVGVHVGPRLQFVGSVGSGLDEPTLRALTPVLRAREVARCPFEPVPKLRRGIPRWVRPELVVQVAFAEWTADGNIRQPVFLGRREDVVPTAVVREP